MKHDCLGNIVKLTWGSQMKQVSCRQAPLCQGDPPKIWRAGLDVVPFFPSFIYLFNFIKFIYLFRSA